MDVTNAGSVGWLDTKAVQPPVTRRNLIFFPPIFMCFIMNGNLWPLYYSHSAQIPRVSRMEINNVVIRCSLCVSEVVNFLVEVLLIYWERKGSILNFSLAGSSEIGLVVGWRVGLQSASQILSRPFQVSQIKDVHIWTYAYACDCWDRKLSSSWGWA